MHTNWRGLGFRCCDRAMLVFSQAELPTTQQKQPTCGEEGNRLDHKHCSVAKSPFQFVMYHAPFFWWQKHCPACIQFHISQAWGSQASSDPQADAPCCCQTSKAKQSNQEACTVTSSSLSCRARLSRTCTRGRSSSTRAPNWAKLLTAAARTVAFSRMTRL